MPSVRLTQHALWNNLGLNDLNICRKGYFFHWRVLQQRNCSLSSTAYAISNSTWRVQHIRNVNGKCAKTKPSWSTLRPLAPLYNQHYLHSDTQRHPHFFKTKHSPGQDNLIARTYDRLHQQASVGKYETVQSMTESLVKRHGEKPSDRLYAALMLANAESWNGSAVEVARLLQCMADDNVEPSSATLHGALLALAVHPDYLLRGHILHELSQRWLSLTQTGWQCVVMGLIRDRQLERALDALQQMHEAGVMAQPWLYDAMIYTLCAAEEFDEVLSLLDHRLDSGELSISPTLWAHVLDSASRALHYKLTVFAFNARVGTSYLNPSSGVCTNILSTAALHGDVRLATSILHILSCRSGSAIQPHHYEALLEAYIARKDLRRSFALLAIMKAAGQLLTEGTTRPIFMHLSQSSQLPDKAKRLLYLMRDEGRVIPIQAINVIIEAHVHHQHLSTAVELYKSMQTLSPDLSPNTATFNYLVHGCASHKRKDIAMFLAREMVALKIAPDAMTYDRLLLVCLNTDEGLDDAWRYLEEMNAAGCEPRDSTLTILVKRACALGDGRVFSLIGDEKGKSLLSNRVIPEVKELWRKESRILS